jgi:predicted RNA-binding protein YlxR (DUF448 family)
MGSQPGAPAHVPTRTCVGCRAVSPSRELVRFVLVDERIQPSARSAGRGAWIHPHPDCVRAAWKARAFARAFRKNVSFPNLDDLIATVAAAAPPRP